MADNLTTVAGETVDGDWLAVNQSIAMYITMVTIGAVGVLGNSIVMATIIANKDLHNKTYALLFNLAVSDTSASLLLLLEYTALTTYETYDGVFGVLLCTIFSSEFLLTCCFTSSMLNLLGLSYERYYGIVHSLYYEANFTWRRVQLIIIAIWGICWIPNIDLAIAFQVNEQVCGEISLPWSFRCFFSIFYFGICYVTPLIGMIVLYGLIVRNLRKNAQALKHIGGGDAGPAATLLQARKKVIRMLVVAVFVYVLTTSGEQFMWLLYGFDIVKESMYDTFPGLAAWPVNLVNICINPFIYFITNTSFRKRMIKTVRCRVGRRDPTVGFEQNSVNLNSISGGVAK